MDRSTKNITRPLLTELKTRSCNNNAKNNNIRSNSDL